MRHAEQVTFGGSALDRAAHLRGDPAALAALRASERARAVVLWQGKPLMDAGGQRLLRLPLEHPLLSEATPLEIFLGQDDDGPVFGYDLSPWSPEEVGQEPPDGSFFDISVQTHPAMEHGEGFVDLKSRMVHMTPRDAELAASLRALQGWHRSHRYCAQCGVESVASMAGWQRGCPACNAQHFPRTDPVVIMLITRGNKTLLGRGAGWPEGMYSCLAGFMEPGETIEAAVRREVFEESGIAVGAVRYLASQPWAFPSSLMIGCQGDALSEAITLDPVELEDARWVSKEDIADALAGTHPDLLPARKGAIAHFLLTNWLADRLD